jgi:hypothetical protein
MIAMPVALGEEPGAIAPGWRPGLAGASPASASRH